MPADVVKSAKRAALVTQNDHVVRADGLQPVATGLRELGAAPDAEPRSREDTVLLHREHVPAYVVALRHRARALNEALDRAKKSGHAIYSEIVVIPSPRSCHRASPRTTAS